MSLSALPQVLPRESGWPRRLLVMGLALAVVAGSLALIGWMIATLSPPPPPPPL